MTDTCKPMDPEHLAWVRSLVCKQNRSISAAPFIAGLRELLADRDFQVARADVLRAERDEARAMCTRVAELLGEDDPEHPADVLAVCIMETLSESRQEVTRLLDDVASLRTRVREAETAMAEETRLREEMQHERDENAAQWMAWRDEALRLRARVRVNKQDAAASGIAPAQAVAWASAHGWPIRLSTPTVTIVSNSIVSVRIPLLADAVDYHACLASAVRELADAEGRPGLDILDEMAAMSVEPT